MAFDNNDGGDITIMKFSVVMSYLKYDMNSVISWHISPEMASYSGLKEKKKTTVFFFRKSNNR